jgi:hypothetical protein
VLRALSLCTCCRQYPGAAAERIALLTSPSRISLPRNGSRVGLRIVLFEMLWGDPAKTVILKPVTNQRSAAMANQNDLSRSVVAFEQHNTTIAVIEMSLNSWLVAGIVPGIERHRSRRGTRSAA